MAGSDNDVTHGGDLPPLEDAQRRAQEEALKRGLVLDPHRGANRARGYWLFDLLDAHGFAILGSILAVSATDVFSVSSSPDAEDVLRAGLGDDDLDLGPDGGTG